MYRLLVAIAVVLTAFPAATCGSGPGGGAGGNGGNGAGNTAGSGAGNAGGGGGSGGGACAGRAPSDAPFGCQTAWADQLAGACQHAGPCGGFLTTVFSGGFHAVTCAYRADGTLAWARRCEDSQVYCGMFCIDSAGAPDPVVACELPNACDAGTD